MIEVSIYYPIARRIEEPAKDRVRFEFVLPKRPFLFWVERHISAELNLPKGYGVAWFDYTTDRALYAPMPFNVLVGIGIWLWYTIRFGFTWRLVKLYQRVSQK